MTTNKDNAERWICTGCGNPDFECKCHRNKTQQEELTPAPEKPKQSDFYRDYQKACNAEKPAEKYENEICKHGIHYAGICAECEQEAEKIDSSTMGEECKSTAPFPLHKQDSVKEGLQGGDDPYEELHKLLGESIPDSEFIERLSKISAQVGESLSTSQGCMDSADHWLAIGRLLNFLPHPKACDGGITITDMYEQFWLNPNKTIQALREKFVPIHMYDASEALRDEERAELTRYKETLRDSVEDMEQLLSDWSWKNGSIPRNQREYDDLKSRIKLVRKMLSPSPAEGEVVHEREDFEGGFIETFIPKDTF